MNAIITAARAQLVELRATRDTAQAAAAAITDTVEADGRDALTAEETATLGDLTRSVREADVAVAAQEARIVDLETAATAQEARDKRAAEAGTREIRVGREETTYRPDSGAGFFADLVRARMGDDQAAARQARHRAEVATPEVRAVGTAGVGGLIPPQYLTAWHAENLQAGFQFGRLATALPLPDDGMVFNIPRGATSSTADVQATEGGAVSNTDYAGAADLDVHVVTIAGASDVTFQLRDRGAGSDRIIFADLVESYLTKFDTQLLSGAGWATGKQHEGVLNSAGVTTVTYTSAAPTGVELLSKIAQAKAAVSSARKLPATGIVMSGTRWAWLTQERDGSNRPLVVEGNYGPQNADGVSTASAQAAGPGRPTMVGAIGNLPVYTVETLPANLGAGVNEDAIIVGRLSDLLIWLEGGDPMPREFSVASVNPAGAGSEVLTCRMVAYGYSAFTADRRPEGIAVITGTGLVAPTFG